MKKSKMLLFNIAIVLACSILVVLSLISLSACITKESEHFCSMSYSKDSSKHWLACDICDKVEEAEAHKFLDGNDVCSVCKYMKNEFDYTYDSDEKAYIVTGLNKTVSEVVIPNIHNSTPVIGVEREAFKNCDFIKSVTVSDSVKYIDDYAFRGCTNLVNVTISDKVEKIGYGVFENCNKISKMVLPFVGANKNFAANGTDANSHFGYIFGAGNYSQNSENISPELTDVKILGGSIISPYAFYGCDKLTNISLPNSVVEIANRAFRYCSSLKQINLPDSVRTIGERSFSDCIELANITIPDSVTQINNNAFTCCSKLNNLVLPNSITTIGAEAFYNCVELSNLEISNGVTTIGIDAFENCPISEVKMPATAISYVDKANLVKVEITGGTEIEDFAFSGSNFLEIVTLSKTIRIIGMNAFNGCEYLTDIKFNDGLNSIGDFAFSGCKLLTKVELPNTVTTLGQCAFEDCINVSYVNLSNSLTCIGSGVFNNCPITDATVSANVIEVLPKYMLENVTVTNGNEIPANAFYNCKSLTNLTLPNSISKIGLNAFFGCDNLNYNIFDNGLYLGNTNNEYLVFVKTKQITLTDIQINEKTKIINSYAFNNCENLENILIPENSVISIGDRAFAGCSKITSIVLSSSDIQSGAGVLKLPNSIVELGNGVFAGCLSLRTATLPNSISVIGERLFYGCSSLESMELSNGVIEIGTDAFNGCTNLKSIKVYNSVTRISMGAFANCTSLTRIEFVGTKSEWLEISREYDWDSATGAYVIYCLGGEQINKDSKVN